MIKTHERFGVTPRLAIVSSGVHFWTQLDSEALTNPEGILPKLNEIKYVSDSPCEFTSRSSTTCIGLFYFCSFATNHFLSQPRVCVCLRVFALAGKATGTR